jgi:hypothetical protein
MMRIHQHPFMGDQANLASYANFDNRIESHFRTQVGLGASIGTGKHGMARNDGTDPGVTDAWAGN